MDTFTQPVSNVLAIFYSDWSAPDWVSVVGLPLALIGLWMAYQQGQDTARAAKATQTAAEATRDAVQKTETQVAENHLLVWIPQLLQATRKVDTEIRHNDAKNASQAFQEWRTAARQVRTLLEKSYPGHEAIALIGTAITLMPPAEAALEQAAGKPLVKTQHVRESMNRAADEAQTIVAERMAYTRNPNG